MFVFGVTVLTKVCNILVLIYNIFRVVITLKYNKHRLPYIYYM